MTTTHTKQLDKNEVLIRVTLMRTLVLTVLTIGFVLLVRWSTLLAHWVNQVAGSRWWNSLYAPLSIGTAKGREQLIMVMIIAACFIVALSLQLISAALWRGLRTRQAPPRQRHTDHQKTAPHVVAISCPSVTFFNAGLCHPE
ncbi:MAG: hypothetical protein AAYR33_02235 [Acetobacteraceae bacterium]